MFTCEHTFVKLSLPVTDNHSNIQYCDAMFTVLWGPLQGRMFMPCAHDGGIGAHNTWLPNISFYTYSTFIT